MTSVRRTRNNAIWSRLSDRAWFSLFVFMAVGATAGLFWLPSDYSRSIPALNALLSIGTSGVVAFLFYYVVSVRLERRRSRVIREGNLSAYRVAKHNIAVAVLAASQRGGRDDLSVDTDTIDQCLTVSGFRQLFEGGREATEGFYAFQNQMHEQTYEFSEILLNLKVIESAAERLVLSGMILDEKVYKRLVSLSHIIRRIESNGPGYDESKRLSQFIWEMFAGWNWVDGQLDHDPIEHAFAAAA